MKNIIFPNIMKLWKMVRNRTKIIIQDRHARYITAPRAIAHIKRNRYYPADREIRNLDSLSYTEDTLKLMDNYIISKMKFLQYKSPAEENNRYLVYHAELSGFAAFLHQLIRALTIGSRYERTIICRRHRIVYDSPYEPIGSLSEKEINKILSSDKKPIDFNYLLQKEKTVHLGQNPQMPWNLSPADRRKNIVIMDSLIANYKLENMPNFYLYYRGLIMDSFLRLKEEYRAHIEERRGMLLPEGPKIGVHIRQGDTTRSWRGFNISSYMHTVEQVVDATGIKTVFISTDSNKALCQLPKDSGIHFIYDDKEKRYDNSIVLMLLENPALKKQETMAILKNIYLLAECDYIIGSQSAFSACALALSYYRNKSLNGILLEHSHILHMNDKISTLGKNRELNGVLLENPTDARLACLTVRRKDGDSSS